MLAFPGCWLKRTAVSGVTCGGVFGEGRDKATRDRPAVPLQLEPVSHPEEVEENRKGGAGGLGEGEKCEEMLNLN